jgi:hypothetical protein
MRPFLIGFGLLLICLVSETRAAGRITLAWDPNLEPDVAGYRLHYGTASGRYTRQIDVGNTTSATVRNLTDGATYFFALTAYNTAGHESAPSQEISYPSPDGLRNISARGLIQIGDRVLIDGFFITGNGQKKVMVRALGPSIPVPSAVSDPVLELHSASGELLATNDNWRTSQQAAIIATGLAPTNDRDSALIATLATGSYTVVVRGANYATGIGLVEVYDLDNVRDTVRLGNISARGYVFTGNNVLIGGFIVGGGDWSTTVVARAIGPSLTNFGIPGALPDPTIALHNGNGTLIAWNDNWKDTQESDLQATGIAPLNDRESAIMTTLPAGNYTAIVAGHGGATGVGLVEIYNLH